VAIWPKKGARQALTFRREGGRPPPDHEVLTVAADGSYRLWRTIARASQPPSPVGRFAGRLPGDRWEQLHRVIDSCGKAEPIELSLPADAAREQVVLASGVSTWADGKIPPAPFDDLAAEARGLLGELTDSPEAALELRVDSNLAVALAQLGSAELDLDLSGASIRAVRWDNDAAAEQWSALIDGPRSVTAVAGWIYELPFDHPFGKEATVSAHVDDLLAFDGEFWRACWLQSRQ
jgi:hypothetical protein